MRFNTSQDIPMSHFLCFRRFLLVIIICVSIVAQKLYSQQYNASDTIHEITIYTMPSLMPLNWDSPSALFKSTKKCYFKTMLIPDNYLIGHIVVGLKTPLLPKPLFTAMTSASNPERVNLVLKEKVGIGIMGAALKGKIEPEENIISRLKIYSKREKLAFITYRVNERAMKRILQFIKEFTERKSDSLAACNFYGGAFWPRYKNEGSGCSAFAMTMLEINNLLDDDANNWCKRVNLPMNLIGGEYNNHKKVKNRSIYKAKSWHNGKGVENVDFISHKIYEPSTLFNWILEERKKTASNYTFVEKDGAPGLYIDKRNVIISPDEPIFLEREKQDVFIRHYVLKRAQQSEKKH